MILTDPSGSGLYNNDKDIDKDTDIYKTFLNEKILKEK
jgi:hypothetical protein